jgi:hypothetical protein
LPWKKWLKIWAVSKIKKKLSKGNNGQTGETGHPVSNTHTLQARFEKSSDEGCLINKIVH